MTMTTDLLTGCTVLAAAACIGAIGEYVWHAMLHAHHKRKGH